MIYITIDYNLISIYDSLQLLNFIVKELVAGEFYYPNTKKKKYPIDPVLRKILPQVFLVGKQIASLYAAENKQKFSPQLLVCLIRFIFINFFLFILF